MVFNAEITPLKVTSSHTFQILSFNHSNMADILSSETDVKLAAFSVVL
jgi:hypothetical protein